MNKPDAAIIDGHEQVCLSAMMNGHADLPVSEDDFASPTNRIICRCITDSLGRGLLAVCDELQRRGQLAAVGGRARLTDISCLPHDPANLEYALSEVRAASQQRQAAKIGEQLHKGAIAVDAARKALAELAQHERERNLPLIEFRSPLQLRNFKPPAGMVLVGDNHVMKRSVFVIGGPPGIGKSLSTVALAVAGATQTDWFGLKVHRKFKVLIVQNENGEFRLSRDFAELNCDTLENFVRVCPPPPYGFCFARAEFRAQLAAAIASFKPDIVIFDPWNAAAYEQDSRQYLDTFDALKSVLPLGDDAPALGIVAHTRKPKTDERASGRGLLNLLAGSYVLGSVPRTVFVMQPASDDTTDNRIVWTCAKNNDGALGARSAWERCNSLFEPVAAFDWESFDAPEKDRRTVITEADVQAIFENGALTKTEAREALEERTGASRASIFRVLHPKGRFAKHLKFQKGKVDWQ